MTQEYTGLPLVSEVNELTPLQKEIKRLENRLDVAYALIAIFGGASLGTFINVLAMGFQQ